MITELENSFLYFCQTDEEENYFKNALIYLCKNDEEGSFGIIINKKVKINLKDFALQPDKELEAILNVDKVFLGGPVTPFSPFVLLSSEAILENKYVASNSSFEVIPERNVISNESEIFLVVRFNLDKDWHTYWINPGDSGDPASFNWNLPEGFNISEPLWPTPELIPILL